MGQVVTTLPPETPHPPHFLSDFSDEKPDRHSLPDSCRASWKCVGAGVRWSSNKAIGEIV